MYELLMVLSANDGLDEGGTFDRLVRERTACAQERRGLLRCFFVPGVDSAEAFSDLHVIPHLFVQDQADGKVDLAVLGLPSAAEVHGDHAHLVAFDMAEIARRSGGHLDPHGSERQA